MAIAIAIDSLVSVYCGANRLSWRSEFSGLWKSMSWP